MKDYEKIARRYGVSEENIADFTWLCRSLEVYRKALKTARKYNNAEKIKEYREEINNILEKLKKYNFHVNKKENTI